MALLTRLLLPVWLLLPLGCSEPTSPAALPPELPVGAPFEPHPGESLGSSWWIPLAPGEAFHATVEQLGTDVVVELRRPDGEHLITIDQPIGRFGPEPVCFVDRDGPGVLLEIRPFEEADPGAAEPPSPGGGEAAGRGGQGGEGRSGPYRLVLEHRRPAEREDRRCWQALKAFTGVVERFRGRSEASPELLGEAIRTRETWQAAGEGFQAAVAEVEAAAIAGRVEDVPSEIEHREAALMLLDALDADDPGVINLRALVLNDLGLAYRAVGRSAEAETALLAAEQAYRALGDVENEAAVVNNRALLAKARGETHHAVALFEQAIETVRRFGSPSLTEAYALLNRGAAEAELGLERRALDALDEAHAQFVVLGDPEGEAQALNITGWIHTLAGREEQALGFFERARGIAVREDLPEVEIAVGDRRGTTLRRLGRFEEARKSYKEALELARKTGRRKAESDILANLGWLEAVGGRPETALDLLGEAHGRGEIRANPDALAYVLGGLARAYRRLDRLDEALEDLEAAIEAIEWQRSIARRQGRRMLGVPLWSEETDLLVDLLIEIDGKRPGQGYGRRAFEVAELARARHLYETLQDAQVDLRADADPALVAREEALRERIDREQTRLAERSLADADEPELAEIERMTRRLLGELEDVRAEIRRTSPRLTQLRDPEAIGVEALQGLLDPETTFVSFELGEKRSFAFVVDVDVFAIVPLPPREEVSRLARAVYEGLAKQGWGRSQLDLTARELSDKVLGPLWPRLAGRRLLVAPDGPLHYIPLAALPRPGSENGLGGEDLVLDRFEVTTVPSATVLATLAGGERGRWRIPESVAVLADPVYPAGGLLTPLPYSRQEAEAIRGVGGEDRVKLFLGSEARPELVTSGELDGFAVFHFASHVLIDEAEPQISHIALSGSLFLHDIYALDLAAEMVVLSGCSSALGEEVEGEGLVGLTRGFFFAGASRVLVTLWPVDDAATAALMEHFYDALFAGFAPAEALVRAQRKTRATPGWEDPTYWAGFLLQGAWL